MNALSLVTPKADAAGPIASVPEIVDELRQGNVVVLVDDEDRENEGDLVFAADFVTPEKINFMAKHARGLVCLTLTEAHARQLALPPMARANGTVHGTNFTVSIEAAAGVTTGISAADRARTVWVATRPTAKASDIVQPGHIFPVVAQAGGVLMRAGHTEAGCDLTQLAGLTPAAVICEIMNDDGTMARLPDLIPFAQAHGLKIGTIADLIHYRAANESIIERCGSRMVRLPAGEFQLVVYRDKPSGAPHLALVKGTIEPQRETLVRVHEPVSVLDFLDEGASAHSWPIPKALAAIAAAPSGVLVLLNCAEPAERLFAKFEALEQASPEEGARQARMDLRTYGIGAQILRDLNVVQMKLLARPRKMPSMAGYGLHTTGFVER
ncbi:MAG TPA: bifunctional 3,4-dihydroxy-2-butanone-4-phosphate synthase/GTP cyclohydrolase II [Burkholderiaceae bacterium]|nr:bifunctional 3,4-dihydroxy-2-butanone-4-phosphate synthase/GTP cyclohydrolase II [Burkholderiaceae bacterium]HQR78048.1 bifunctional 3,4-dihydroxy-2-butanone-4-phosphate synthase/GTP cyclohydrolase II [Burkholderiaceae bacterium]